MFRLETSDGLLSTETTEQDYYELFKIHSGNSPWYYAICSRYILQSESVREIREGKFSYAFSKQLIKITIIEFISLCKKLSNLFKTIFFTGTPHICLNISLFELLKLGFDAHNCACKYLFNKINFNIYRLCLDYVFWLGQTNLLLCFVFLLASREIEVEMVLDNMKMPSLNLLSP